MTLSSQITEIGERIERTGIRLRQEIEELTYFISWDIENNMPTFRVDISTISLDTLWIA